MVVADRCREGLVPIPLRPNPYGISDPTNSFFKWIGITGNDKYLEGLANEILFQI